MIHDKTSMQIENSNINILVCGILLNTMKHQDLYLNNKFNKPIEGLSVSSLKFVNSTL
jgi:hypothetical protein